MKTKNLKIMKCIMKVPKQCKFHQLKKEKRKNQSKLLKTSFINLGKICEKKIPQVNKD